MVPSRVACRSRGPRRAGGCCPLMALGIPSHRSRTFAQLVPIDMFRCRLKELEPEAAAAPRRISRHGWAGVVEYPHMPYAAPDSCHESSGYAVRYRRQASAPQRAAHRIPTLPCLSRLSILAPLARPVPCRGAAAVLCHDVLERARVGAVGAVMAQHAGAVPWAGGFRPFAAGSGA